MAGEYECTFYENECGFEFETDFFSNKVLVRSFKPLNESTSALYACIEKGHVVIGVNGESVEGLSFNETMELMKMMGRPLKLRFCDTKRALVEKNLMKKWGKMIPLEETSEQFIQEALDASQDAIWHFNLLKAENLLGQLSPGYDPLVSLHLAEVYLMRVIFSKDSKMMKECISKLNFAIHASNALGLLCAPLTYKSLSCQVALAEAYAMLALVNFFQGNMVHSANSWRISWEKYGESLHNLTTETTKSKKKVSGEALSGGLSFKAQSSSGSSSEEEEESLLKDHLRMRVYLGMGSCLVYSALTPPRYRWILSLCSVECNVSLGLKYLRECYQWNGLRSRWSAFALLNVATAVRVAEGKCFNNAALCNEIFQLEKECLDKYSKCPLFLWSCSRSTKSRNHLVQSLTLGNKALALARHSTQEKQHKNYCNVLSSYVAWLHFICLEWEEAGDLYQQVFETTTTTTTTTSGGIRTTLAETTLHYEAAVYLGACYAAKKKYNQAAEMIQLVVEKGTLDPILMNRLRLYLTRPPYAYALLPFELVYIYWQDSNCFNNNRTLTGIKTYKTQFSQQIPQPQQPSPQISKNNGMIASSSFSTTGTSSSECEKLAIHQLALVQMDKLGAEMPFTENCRRIVLRVCENDLLGVPSCILDNDYHSKKEIHDESKDQPIKSNAHPRQQIHAKMGMDIMLLGEWLVLRGTIMRRLGMGKRALPLFVFASGLGKMVPQSCYVVPISLFLIACDRYEAEITVPGVQTVICSLLTRAQKYAKNGSFSYDQLYKGKIANMLKIIQTSCCCCSTTSPPARKDNSMLKRQTNSITAQFDNLSINKKPRIFTSVRDYSNDIDQP